MLTAAICHRARRDADHDVLHRRRHLVEFLLSCYELSIQIVGRGRSVFQTVLAGKVSKGLLEAF